MEELQQDNAFLQRELMLVQCNLDRYVRRYEKLSEAYDAALEEIRALQRVIVPEGV